MQPQYKPLQERGLVSSYLEKPGPLLRLPAYPSITPGCFRACVCNTLQHHKRLVKAALGLRQSPAGTFFEDWIIGSFPSRTFDEFAIVTELRVEGYFGVESIEDLAYAYEAISIPGDLRYLSASDVFPCCRIVLMACL